VRQDDVLEYPWGIDRPTAGRIEVNGSNLVDLSEGGLVQIDADRRASSFQFL